ncbi:MAG: hypothetical protein RBU27_11070 [Bacteroidota bacterium]|jgi:hypothetical protein|nr:hypothetical protein [Bacteroidota bacterium]
MPTYHPRFFSQNDFDGLVAIIETMIVTTDGTAVDAHGAAADVDRYLSRIESPALEQIRLAIDAIDSWYMPLLLNFRFGRFRDLPLAQRRAVIERIIHPSGLFKAIAAVRAGARDAARTLKLLASIGYYGSEAGIRITGYQPVEERPRFQALDQTPRAHPDPFAHSDPVPGGGA